MGYLEIIATLSTIIAVILTAKEIKQCWYFGLASVVSLTMLYYQNNMFGQVILQMIFLIQTFLGWYNWNIKKNILINRIENRTMYFDIILALGIGFLFASLSSNIENKPIRFDLILDGVAASIALLANLYLTRKILQSWLLFMAYNLILMVLLFTKELYLLSTLNIFLFLISLGGYFSWKKNLVNR